MLNRYTTHRVIPAPPPRFQGDPQREPEVVQSLNVFAVVRDALIALVALVVLLTFWPLRSVPTGSRGVITVGGAIRNIQSEGYTLLAPWQNLTLFSTRAEASQIEGAEGATSDTQPVRVTLTVRYSISPERVADVYEKYSHNGDLSTYVDTATREAFKAVTARFSAPELISKRSDVSSAVVAAVRQKLDVYGAQVISVDVTSFLFSESYMAAISAKVNQEQLRMAAENKLRTVEAEQKQKVAVAEAEATAVQKTADGDAYAKVKRAQAEATALQVQNEALSKNRDVLELRRIEVQLVQAQKWNGALPGAIYAGAPIHFIQVPHGQP